MSFTSVSSFQSTNIRNKIRPTFNIDISNNNFNMNVVEGNYAYQKYPTVTSTSDRIIGIDVPFNPGASLQGWIPVIPANKPNPNIYFSAGPVSRTNLPSSITTWFGMQSNLNLNTSLYIKQNITFPSIGNYKLTFYIAGRNGYYNGAHTLKVLLNAITLLDNTAANTSNWTKKNVDFTISSTGIYTLFFYFNSNTSTDSTLLLTGVSIALI